MKMSEANHAMVQKQVRELYFPEAKKDRLPESAGEFLSELEAKQKIAEAEKIVCKIEELTRKLKAIFKQ